MRRAPVCYPLEQHFGGKLRHTLGVLSKSRKRRVDHVAPFIVAEPNNGDVFGVCDPQFSEDFKKLAREMIAACDA